MTWAVRVRQERRLGTGTVISSRLAITAHHVVANGENAEVETPDGNVVAAVIDRDAELDVALLVPSSETDVFSYDLRVIPRLLYRGHRLCEGRALIELCTDEPGASRTLDVEVRPSDERTEWVEFLVEPGRDGVRHGYSGGPVPEVAQYSRRPRLFGIVRARDELSVTVDLTAGRGWFVPVDRMAERFESVNALVETPIERSAAWDEHWEPRSRGVATAADPGFFFTGRTKAYERLRAHLERGRGLLVISGPRGRGKSALLARVVVLGCRRYLTLLGEARADAV